MRKSIALLVIIIALLAVQIVNGQNKGQLTGVVRDRNTQELLIGVSVLLEGTAPPVGGTTDAEGRYRIDNIPTGSYNVRASFVGYEPLTKYNIVVNSGNAGTLNFELLPADQQLDEVTVTYNRSVRVATPETPLSIQNLSSEEIKSNPGGNFDISRVVQTLPGVAGTGGTGTGFRNDIVIRGGGPNENVYYLDGIEIPTINHFSTQGSAGGPQGILNVSFIEDVTLSSSAFDARYDNALASVFQFRQREGNPDRFQGNLRLSATELAATVDGPLSPKTTFLASARRSYLQFLFQAIDLPIRPNYWDFQYKLTHKLGPKTTLTTLGVGAIDQFTFAVPRESTPEKEYAIRANPSINQWNYTVGTSLRQLIQDGYVNVALSRNAFDNALDRFEDGQSGDESRRALKARSRETETKLRVDVNKFVGGWKYAFGVVGQYVQFSNAFFNRLRREVRDESGTVVQPEVLLDFDTNLDFFRFGAFGQASRSLLGDRLNLSFGVRTDGNSFTDEGRNLLRTLSPRASASYALSGQWKVNASVGRYYKTPIYTVLGFRDQEGNYTNRDSRYIRSDHYVAGVEYLPTPTTRFTVEGFYKRYADYPVSVRDGISLANQGGEFGAIGNEDVASTGRGRAYGAEFFFQQKLAKNLFAVFSYTYVRSEFTGLDGRTYVPSAWDNRHLVSALLGRKFKRGWEMGLKYRFAGGVPYTPFDLDASQRNYLSLGTGVLDYERLNTERLPAFNQFDFRLDKKWNWRRLTLDLYLDVQNALLLPSPTLPQYTFRRTEDNATFASTDDRPVQPDGANALPTLLEESEPSVLPTIGFIVEF
jgi:hypothetical protein